MKKFFIVTICLIIINSIYGCDCGKSVPLDSLRKRSFERSENIFLGNLINYTDTTLEFKIIEKFKGSFNDNVIKGKNEIYSCSIFPDSLGLWLVYGNFKDSEFHVLDCGLTRSLSYPIIEFDGFQFPYIPSPNQFLDNNLEDIKTINKNKAKHIFFEELVMLREYGKVQKKSKNHKSKVIFFGTILILIIFVILCFIWSKLQRN